MTERQDVLLYLNPKDLVGRTARKRKGRVYTAIGQLCVNIWHDPETLTGINVGALEVTQSASAKYLWHRREKFDDVITRERLAARET